MLEHRRESDGGETSLPGAEAAVHLLETFLSILSIHVRLANSMVYVMGYDGQRDASRERDITCLRVPVEFSALESWETSSVYLFVSRRIDKLLGKIA